MKVLLLEEKKNGLEFVVRHLHGVGGVSFMLAKSVEVVPEFVKSDVYDFCFASLQDQVPDKLSFLRGTLSENTLLILALANYEEDIITDLVDDRLTCDSDPNRLFRLVGLAHAQSKYRDSPDRSELVKSIREIRRISNHHNAIVGKARR